MTIPFLLLENFDIYKYMKQNKNFPSYETNKKYDILSIYLFIILITLFY
jgi:hypothetical protein